MNFPAAVAELLSRRLGLSSKSLGKGVVERALDVVFAKARPEDRELVIARLLEGEGEEWQLLVDEVVVPETWFFRNPEAFELLASYVIEKWRPAHRTKPFQALCIPCASGEEAYSIAMTLLDAGLEPGRIQIDAADISERLLARARMAVYGKLSFREKAVRFRQEYLLKRDEGWRVRDDIVRLVHFEKANLLDLSRYRQRAPYDVIFCRNALMFLDESARRQVAAQLRELLHEEGLLFVGSSEVMHFCDSGFYPVDFPQSFACRKGKPTAERSRARSAILSAARVPARPVAMTQTAAVIDSSGKLEIISAPEPSSTFEQANQLAGRGDLEAAAAICQGLLTRDPRNPDVYALLGVISESKGELESAEEHFRKALYLDPDHYESLLHMSLLCDRRGDVEGSRLYRARAGRALGREEEKPVLKGL